MNNNVLKSFRVTTNKLNAFIAAPTSKVMLQLNDKFFCNSFVMTYVGVKCLTRHCSVLRDTRTRGTT